MITVGLVVAVIAVAYGTQAPSLGVAEFAPAARNQLEAPPTTAGDAPSAKGAQGRRSTTTTAPPAATNGTAQADAAGSAPTTRVGRARQCYGNPPRQTEDPLSPACMPTIFEGDNGGATTTGVSSTEIRIAIPGADSAFEASTSSASLALKALFAYANQRFELYGRRLVPVFVPGQSERATQARALGADTAGAGVFGALLAYRDADYYSPPQVALPQELARRGVVSVAHNRAAWWSDDMLFDSFHPFVWSVLPSAEQQQRQLAATACALLAGSGTARHTSDPDLVGQPRKFGVIGMGYEIPLRPSVLARELEACSGADPVTASWAELPDPNRTQLRAIVERFAAERVTTVVCVCLGFMSFRLVFAGAEASYRPEWVYSGTNYSGGSDEYLVQQLGGLHADGSAVRVESGPRLVPLQARPWFQALVNVDPALVSLASNLPGLFNVAQYLYPQLLLMASGIQMAGPTLTPETFAAGLMSASFPNQSGGQGPDFLPSVGFGPGDHGFYDDFAISWWSQEAPALEPNSYLTNGSWCFVGSGTRFRPETVPTNLDSLLNDPAAGCR